MLRVLLVDDEPFIVQGLMVFVDWEQEGYEIVYTAADGAEALTYLKEHKVDLVISDIKMPVMSGLELLETIRRENISDAINEQIQNIAQKKDTLCRRMYN